MDSTLGRFQFLKRLTDAGVEYVVIGGVAAILHGSARMTLDLDVCCSLAEPNLSRILAALRGSNPRHRMRPDKLPMPDDPDQLRGFRNLYLTTDLGVIDFFDGGDRAGRIQRCAFAFHGIADVDETTCRVLNLDALIAAKRAANRPKDRLAVVELEVIKKLREQSLDGASRYSALSVRNDGWRLDPAAGKMHQESCLGPASGCISERTVSMVMFPVPRREVAQKHLVLATVGLQELLIVIGGQYIGDEPFGLGNAKGLVIEFQLREPGLLELLDARLIPGRWRWIRLEHSICRDEKVICSLAPSPALVAAEVRGLSLLLAVVIATRSAARRSRPRAARDLAPGRR